MKASWIILVAALLISSILLPAAYFETQNKKENKNSDVFLGVTFGSNSTLEAKALVDKIKDYTNLFIVDSWDISTNESELNEVCNYAVSAGLKVMVYYDFISFVGYPWLQGWLNTAKERWGNNFLGIYLYDEPGGRQIDTKQWHTGDYARKAMQNASNYDDAAYRYVNSITQSLSNQNLKSTGIPLATSDYALYWFDYLSDYSVVFAELVGSNQTSKIQQIDLCRGAANVQNKQWGVIITRSNDTTSTIENGTSMLSDMSLAYQAGAKFIVVFNYDAFPGENPSQTLTEDQFQAIRDFWNQINSDQQGTFGTIKAEVALVLPKNYGWGLRTPTDAIWGLWNSDALSPIIWNRMNQLLNEYGMKLDIIYNDTAFNFQKKYSEIYYWNG